MKMRSRVALISLVSCLLSACSSIWVPPEVDRAYFKPASKSEQNLSAFRLKWLVREDAHEFCARITGHPITAVSKPMACAYWSQQRRECTIITPFETAYNYLGHELRHCFEGSYHG